MPTTYIDWKCTPDKKHVCNEITINWNAIKEDLLTKSNDDVEVEFRFFEMEEVKLKDGSLRTCLKSQCKSVNMA